MPTKTEEKLNKQKEAHDKALGAYKEICKEIYKCPLTKEQIKTIFEKVDKAIDLYHEYALTQKE